jgi:hypothetical protein
MRRLTTGIRSEKCVVRRFRRCANVIEFTYTNLNNITYCTPTIYEYYSLLLLGYKPVQHVTLLNIVGNCNTMVGIIIQYVRKVALHLGYGTQIWLSVSKLPLKSAVVSLYSVVKQWLKCNTGKVCNCLFQFLLAMILSIEEHVFISAQRLSERTVLYCNITL